MNKFKEILLLKNLKRVGNSAINGKYNKILSESQDIDDLISKIMQIESKFAEEDLMIAKNKAEEIYDYVNNLDGVKVITIFDDNYPEKLDVMKNSKPAILYAKGDLKVLENPNIAVIGTRNPSELSQEFEEDLVKSIVNNSDKVIVSGLALGCDKIAHKTTVDEKKITIAVLPSFVDEIVPASNKKLVQSILETGGCLISEYEPGTKVYKSNYVNRDKIVAAFSDSTFVVECGKKSGTLHTVKAADKFKRQIYFYLPNEIPEKSYEGNILISTEYADAIKVDDIEEFVNELNLNKTVNSSKKDYQSTF